MKTVVFKYVFTVFLFRNSSLYVRLEYYVPFWLSYFMKRMKGPRNYIIIN